ncbi:MAG: hypothetical protein B6247_10975 [Candidatus Parabeggiatoa sp. nov. 2]|nr:MAG: hypothetical protein B6247_10975 [Beggiatoa sp. 4572_84]
MRQKSVDVIQSAENLVNKFANTPKEFDKTFSEFKAEYQVFTDTIAEFEKAGKDVSLKSAGTSVAGVAAGVGVATLAPSAAMAIATTFGTASTGTPIASLSGTAATRAALAWLGGGAVTAGGGVAGGNALLALAGPVGIGIGAFTLVGSGLYASSKNKEIVEKAEKQRAKVETLSAELKPKIVELRRLIELTENHQKGVSEILSPLESSTRKNFLGTLINYVQSLFKSNVPKDYQSFSSDQKTLLASLINHVQSLSKLLNKKVQ